MFDMISKTGELVCEFCGKGEKDNGKWPRVWEVPKHWCFLGAVFDYVCCEICMIKFHRLIQSIPSELRELDRLCLECHHYKNGGNLSMPINEFQDRWESERLKAKNFLEEKMTNDNLSIARGTEAPQGV